MPDPRLTESLTLSEALHLAAFRRGGQVKLASQLGINQGRVSRIVKGVPMSLDEARRIIRHYPSLRQAVLDALVGDCDGEPQAPTPSRDPAPVA